MIRAATTDDIPFLLHVARERYGARFDEKAVAIFLARAVSDRSMCVLITQRGAAIAAITRSFWGDLPRAYMMFIAALPGRGLVADGVRLARAVDAWRREVGADSLHFGEDTGLDFSALARRIGAVPDRPTYVIRGGANPAAAEIPITAPGYTLLDRVLTFPNLMGAARTLRLAETG